MGAAGEGLTLAEASAMKLYSARAATEVALEAVQLFGGNGYMAEFQVEQLARDAKVLQIYAGTDEIQITHIARELLAGVSRSRYVRAAVVAGTLSGVPSTLWALVRGRPLTEAARAAGQLLGKPTLVRGLVAHAALTCVWTAVLVPALPTRRRVGLGARRRARRSTSSTWRWSARRVPHVRDLARLPQPADHLAFGALVGAFECFPNGPVMANVTPGSWRLAKRIWRSAKNVTPVNSLPSLALPASRTVVPSASPPEVLTPSPSSARMIPPHGGTVMLSGPSGRSPA